MQLPTRPLCLALALLGACASAPRRGPLPGSVQALYIQGVEDSADGLFPEALKAFEAIKTKFPYSRFAALAELRSGDVQVRREHHQEAIDTYRTFLQYHPNHLDAEYAAFNIGEAYLAQIPADWWFMPPTAEKDQASTRQAIAAYDDMLARFGDGHLADRARAHRRDCRRRLANHEMYAAQFYFRNAQYRAAAQRAESLLHDFADLGLDAQALWLQGRARLRLGEAEAARAPLEQLQRQFSASLEGQEAARLLSTLPKP